MSKLNSHTLNHPSTISSKLPKNGQSIFSIMSGLANEHDAINLSQGFPDFNPDERLTKLVTEGMRKGFKPIRTNAGYDGITRGNCGQNV